LKTGKEIFTFIWQWLAIAAAYPAANFLAGFADQNSIYIKVVYGLSTMAMMFLGPAYFVKILRYSANVWQGKGMIMAGSDSGQEYAARIYLGRSRPHILLAPLSHFALKWKFRVGQINLDTGSVSVGDIAVTDLIAQEKLCRPIGTNDSVSGTAAIHLAEIMESSIGEKPMVVFKLREDGLKMQVEVMGLDNSETIH